MNRNIRVSVCAFKDGFSLAIMPLVNFLLLVCAFKDGYTICFERLNMAQVFYDSRATRGPLGLYMSILCLCMWI